jgi:predicted metal-dependent HD superfamily phosphohydrolase
LRAIPTLCYSPLIIQQTFFFRFSLESAITFIAFYNSMMECGTSDGMFLNTLADVAVYVKRLFEEHNKPYLLYHNFEHTESVARHAREIAGYYPLPAEDLFILEAAAWFHDTGHLFTEMHRHENASIDQMKKYLDQINIVPTIQSGIARCIMATRMPVHPVDLLEEIICDADTYHLGTPDFIRTDQLVWQEVELRKQVVLDDHIGRSLQFMQKHNYYTTYCQVRLSEGKKQNIALLQQWQRNVT